MNVISSKIRTTIATKAQAALVAAAALALAVVLATAGRTDFWLDEIFGVVLAELPTWAEFWSSVPFDKPLLDYAILRLVPALGGSGEWAYRLPAWLFIVGNCVLLALCCRSAREGTVLACVSVFLYSTDPNAMSYGQQALPYSQLTFWCLLFHMATSRALTGGSWRWFGAAIAAGAMAHFTAYTAVFFLVASITASFIAAGPATFRWMRGVVLTLVAVVPLAATYLMQIADQIPESFRSTFPQGMEVLQEATVGVFSFDMRSPINAVAALISGGVFVLGIWVAHRERDFLRITCAYAVVVGAALATGALWWQDHWLSARYFLPVVPLRCIVQGGAVLWLMRRLPRRMPIVACAVAAGLLWAAACFSELFTRHRHFQKYQLEVESVAALFPDSTDIVILSGERFTSYCLRFYWDRIIGFSRCAPEFLIFDADDGFQAARVSVADHVWVSSLVFGTDRQQFAAVGAGPVDPDRLLAAYTGETRFKQLAPGQLLEVELADEFVLSGWHHPESWGETGIRWAKKRAAIGVAIAERGELRVKVRLFPRPLADGIERSFSLTVGNHRDTFLLSAGQFHEVQASFAHPGGNMIIEIATDDEVPCADPATPGDSRQLSAAVDWVQIESD